MKLNKILLTASLLLGGVSANAQETVTEYVFQPHWYGQAQFGLQETLGEGAFGKLLSPNAQLAVGYKFNPYIGARFAVNAWQSKGVSNIPFDNIYKGYRWKWNYVAPTVDAVVDMTNLIGGFNPNRLVEVNLIAGIGFNIGFSNDEANKINSAFRTDNGMGADYMMLENAWDGTKARFLGQFGVDVNFNVTDRLQVGLELMANTLSDNYNSKRGSNTDWYFNGLVGVKYAFGTTFTKQKRKKCCAATAEPKIIEKIVEVPVEKIVVKEVIKEVPAPLTRDVFFKISTIKITKDEMYKVAEVARYMKTNPDTKVTVTGYADKGTGSMKLNLRLSAQRAEAVANALIKEYGIASDRITVKSMGEVEDQPYPTPAQNRVAICIVE